MLAAVSDTNGARSGAVAITKARADSKRMLSGFVVEALAAAEKRRLHLHRSQDSTNNEIFVAELSTHGDSCLKVIVTGHLALRMPPPTAG
jgi:hypothetical protein